MKMLFLAAVALVLAYLFSDNLLQIAKKYTHNADNSHPTEKVKISYPTATNKSLEELLENKKYPNLNDCKGNGDALKVFNYYRKIGGIPEIEEDAELSKAAQIHTHYVVTNKTQAIDFHSEDPRNPLFTQLGDKSARASNGSGGKNICEAVETLFFTDPLHRYHMQNPNLKKTGFGFEEGIATVDVTSSMDENKWKNWPVVFPADKQADIPIAAAPLQPDNSICMDSNSEKVVEVPAQAGFTIMLQFEEFTNSQPALENFTLQNINGEMIPNRYCTSQKGEYFNFIAIYPKNFLDYGMIYKVYASGTYEGYQFERNWSFSTEKQWN